MRLNKKIAILLMTLLLTACWDSQELDQRAIIGGVGIDIEEDMFKVTVQVVPAEAAKAVLGGTTGGDPNLIWDITTKGVTVVDALFETKAITGRDPSFSHTRVLVFSEELAKRGMRDAIDYFKRNEEIRRRSWIIIAEDKIEDIFKIENKLNIIPTSGMSEIMETASSHTDVAAIDLHTFSKKASCSSSCAYAPIVYLRDKDEQKEGEDPEEDSKKKGTSDSSISDKQTDFHKTAVFDDYKMVGILNKKETRGMLWCQNKISVTAIDVKSPRDKKSLINLTINTSKTSIEPELLENGEIKIKIKVEAGGFINEKHDFELDISDYKVMAALDNELSKVIEEEITAAIKKAQSIKADVFDFGDSIYKKYPKEWEKIEDNWPDVFQKLNFELEFETRVTWSGRVDDNG